jgi:hypothetical protein
MKFRHKEIPACALCSNVEDLLVVGSSRLCENCRTCSHGTVYFSLIPETLCLQCVRAVFTDYTWVGPRISDMAGYVTWARDHGFHRDDLLVWTFDEQEEMLDSPLWMHLISFIPVDVEELLRQK